MSDVVNDADFAQAFTITRSEGGSWQAGVWTNATTEIPSYGIIQPATKYDLKQVPEGDRVEGALSFHSSQPIFKTHTVAQNDTNAGISDIIVWHNQSYRIAYVYPWADFGFFKAVGVRMSGQ